MQKVEKRDAGMRDNFRTLFLFVVLFLTFALPVSANILEDANRQPRHLREGCAGASEKTKRCFSDVPVGHHKRPVAFEP